MADDRRFSDEMTDSGFFGSEGGDGAEVLDPAVIELVDELVGSAPPGREGLIRVLLGLQQAFNRVSWRVQELVADRFDLSPAQVAGVVSYYPKLSADRCGRLSFDVCTGTACFLHGGDRILEAVTREADGRISPADEPRLAVRRERCLGVCGLAPALRVGDRMRAPIEHGTATELVKSFLGPGPEREDDR